MNLSDHLTLREVTRSQTATRHGIDNTPTDEHLASLKVLARELFEPLRAYASNARGKSTPLHISSGYRSKKLNTKIGGSRTSQHSKGEALDIDIDGRYRDFSNTILFNLIAHKLDFDQLIWEFGTTTKPDWVHVSYVSREKNRKSVIRAYRENGKTKYTKMLS